MVRQQKCYIHGEATEKRGRIRRNWATMGGPLMDAKQSDTKTMWENWQKGVGKYASKAYAGERYLENGKYTGFRFKTFKEMDTLATQFRSGMRAMGVQPRQHVAIYSKNRTEWQVADVACQSIGCVSIPLYDTLGPEAAAYVIDNAECVACVTEMSGLDNVLNAQTDHLRTVIVLPPRTFDKEEEWPKYKDLVAKANNTSQLNVVSYESVLEAGKKNPHPPVPPAYEDMCTICYTSGTTGVPKGAITTHGQMMTDVIAVQSVVDMYEDDAIISYLPLAHMYERLMEVGSVATGGRICYFRGDVLLLLEDLQEAKPTVFVGVPRLFNRIYDKIMAQINEAGFIKKSLFNFAYNHKKKNLEASGSLTSMFDFVFGKVRNAFGGQVRVMVTGSAPISATIMEFLRIACSCSVVEGYGQTETAAAATTTPESDQKGAGHVGVPIPACEIALFDVPEMNYTQNDVVNGKRVERGEICFRGPIVTKGYWKMPEKTAEAIDEDGWLHSGDIGLWMENGYLKIIDRKKNIFKLSQGEYVAPEKIENCYTTSSFIAQAFCYGDSLKSSLVGIIVPDVDVVVPWLQQQGKKVKTLSEACKEPVLKKMILDQLIQKAKEFKLHGFERIKAIHLHDELFSAENGLLTPTFKLKRPVAKKQFMGVIEHLYTQVPVSKSKL